MTGDVFVWLVFLKISVKCLKLNQTHVGITSKDVVNPLTYDNRGGTAYTLGSFIGPLNLFPATAAQWHIGKIQQRQKGGLFYFTEETPLWAERTNSYEYVSGIRLKEDDEAVTSLIEITDDY